MMPVAEGAACEGSENSTLNDGFWGWAFIVTAKCYAKLSINASNVEEISILAPLTWSEAMALGFIGNVDGRTSSIGVACHKELGPIASDAIMASALMCWSSVLSWFGSPFSTDTYSLSPLAKFPCCSLVKSLIEALLLCWLSPLAKFSLCPFVKSLTESWFMLTLLN